MIFKHACDIRTFDYFSGYCNFVIHLGHEYLNIWICLFLIKTFWVVPFNSLVTTICLNKKHVSNYYTKNFKRIWTIIRRRRATDSIQNQRQFNNLEFNRLQCSGLRQSPKQSWEKLNYYKHPKFQSTRQRTGKIKM